MRPANLIAILRSPTWETTDLSAIAAAILPASAPSLELVESIIDEMPYRALDGRDVWSEPGRAIGLGVRLALPSGRAYTKIYVAESMVVSGDVRLDNREELFRLLALPPSEPISDLELIARTYTRWGNRCVEYLLGDFAFVIWNIDKACLFCARDHMGIKPLFFRFEEAGLLVCSEIRPLLSPGAPFADLREGGPNLGFLADFVENRLPEGHDLMFPQIRRLPGGHVLSYRFGYSPELHQYWQPAPSIEAPFPETTDFPMAFRTLFTEAVRCRLDSHDTVAAMLSGGLDSTSIAFVAAQLARTELHAPLKTLSAVFSKTPQWSEDRYITEAAQNPDINAVLFAMDDYAPLEGIDETLASFGGLISAPGLKMNVLLTRKLAALDVRVFLDGHGGDEVVSHGFGRLFELAKQNKWLRLWQELGAYQKLYGRSRLAAFLLFLSKYGAFPGRYRLRQIMRFAARHTTGADLNMLGPKLMQAEATAKARRPNDAATAAISDVNADADTEASQHLAVMRSVNQISSLETLELTAALAGLDVRFPFFDKRLVEFCLALPSEQKLDQGQIRLILRRAMEGILPKAIQWRASKFDFTPHIAMGLISHHSQLIKSIINNDANGLGDYINLGQVRKDFEYIKQTGYRANGAAVQRVWKAAVLSAWLVQTQTIKTSNNA